MIQEKKCKGTHRYTFGLGCGRLVEASKRKFGIATDGKCDCWKEWLKSDASDEFINGNIIPKAKKTVAKEEKAKSNEEKSLSYDWSKKLQDEINKIVRTIDKGLPCLARNKRGQMHAGHVYARGGNSTIKYNLHNIHRQNAQSNHYQNDDGKLREGLINEYGQEYMDFISQLRRTPMLTFNNKEYRELTYLARNILKLLKEADRIYSLSERIEMRNRVNVELEIYDKEYLVYG